MTEWLREHPVTSLYALTVVIFAVATGLAFREIHSEVEARHADTDRALAIVKRHDCEQTTARWETIGAVIVEVTRQTSLAPGITDVGLIAQHEVANRLKVEERARLIAVNGPRPACG